MVRLDSDREIIEWIANAQVGQAIPFGSDAMLTALARAGYTNPDADFDGPRVTAWAQDWLEQHPS